MADPEKTGKESHRRASQSKQEIVSYFDEKSSLLGRQEDIEIDLNPMSHHKISGPNLDENTGDNLSDLNLIRPHLVPPDSDSNRCNDRFDNYDEEEQLRVKA